MQYLIKLIYKKVGCIFTINTLLFISFLFLNIKYGKILNEDSFSLMNMLFALLFFTTNIYLFLYFFFKINKEKENYFINIKPFDKYNLLTDDLFIDTLIKKLFKENKLLEKTKNIQKEKIIEIEKEKNILEQSIKDYLNNSETLIIKEENIIKDIKNNNKNFEKRITKLNQILKLFISPIEELNNLESKTLNKNNALIKLSKNINFKKYNEKLNNIKVLYNNLGLLILTLVIESNNSEINKLNIYNKIYNNLNELKLVQEELIENINEIEKNTNLDKKVLNNEIKEIKKLIYDLDSKTQNLMSNIEKEINEFNEIKEEYERINKKLENINKTAKNIKENYFFKPYKETKKNFKIVIENSNK